MCGEKRLCALLCQVGPGSPPRVRGKVSDVYGVQVADRITPACAGKSHGSENITHLHEDHPRVCGEKLPREPGGVTPWGSPPRVRGKATHRQPRECRLGITPACAGKSGSRVANRIHFWDHPRVCGEKTMYFVQAVSWMGSPPRVRGKADEKIKNAIAVRITPACAGKSACHHLGGSGHRDHPRVCGEKKNHTNFIKSD